MMYRYAKEDLAKLPKQDLLLEYKLVVQGLEKTTSYEKINWYIEYKEDIKKEIFGRMK